MEPPERNQTTDFGYETVPLTEKRERVAGVFKSVANQYDLMNDVMSVGLHRLWKRQMIGQARLRPGHEVLDLAAGTGDLSRLASARVGKSGRVVMSDINPAMLSLGRDRMLDAGCVNIEFALVDAETLPFPDSSFDRVMIGFGLRNVTEKMHALSEMARVLRPGGMALILEFSQVYVKPLRPLYDAYSFHVLPRMGRLLAGDSDSYRYLAESIRMHPDQETLLGMMEDAGFEDCHYTNLNAGVVAIHRGCRY